MDEWVFVDTCIWASYFKKPQSPEKIAVDSLLDADSVALVGPVVAEVLMGFRRKDQADWAASRLQLAHFLEPTWGHWRAAADLARDLAANGHTLPLTDVILAVMVKQCNAWIYTTDPDFDVIPDLKRYWPADNH